MKSVSQHTWMWRSWGQQHSPSYKAAQYPFSLVQSSSPTRMLYALSTLFLQSVQNLCTRKSHTVNSFLFQPLTQHWKKGGKRHIESDGCDSHTLPVFTQVRLQRLQETSAINKDDLISALLRHQLPHIHPASPVSKTYNYYSNTITIHGNHLLNL